MTAPQTVYDHIEDNNRKTKLLLLLFPLSLFLLFGVACFLAVLILNDRDFTFDGVRIIGDFWPDIKSYITQDTLVFWSALGYSLAAFVPIVVLASIWMGISYIFGDKMMLGFANVQPLNKQDNPQVFRLVENVAMAAGLPLPKIYIIEDDSLNAFATGRNPENASIALTSGILKKLNPDELEGVIAHEMGHVGNRDIRLNLLIITGLSVFGFVADFLRLGLNKNNRNSKNGQLQLLLLFLIAALLIFNFIVAPLIRLAVSRAREYAADATGALITRNPLALARALARISEDSRVEILDKSPTMAVACIADPKLGLNSLKELTATHPSIESRIERLKSMDYLYQTK